MPLFQELILLSALSLFSHHITIRMQVSQKVVNISPIISKAQTLITKNVGLDRFTSITAVLPFSAASTNPCRGNTTDQEVLCSSISSLTSLMCVTDLVYCVLLFICQLFPNINVKSQECTQQIFMKHHSRINMVLESYMFIDFVPYKLLTCSDIIC